MPKHFLYGARVRKLNFYEIEYSCHQPKLKARGRDCEYFIIKYQDKLELHQFVGEMSYLLYRGGTINLLKKIAKGIEENNYETV
jgi:hypothetical protein